MLVVDDNRDAAETRVESDGASALTLPAALPASSAASGDAPA